MKKSRAKKFFAAIVIIVVLAGLGYLGYLYKDYFIKKYDVEFDVNGGTPQVESVEVQKNKTVDLPVVSKEGYDFVGWFDGETEWKEDSKVKKDLVLTAKWKAKKFTITFVIDGQNHTAECDYDSMPVCPVPVEKEGTAVLEYTFTNWTPALQTVKGQATYTAEFSSKERDWNIILGTNLENAGNLSGAGEFLHNTDNTISVTVNKGYIFEGWYAGESLISTETTYVVQDLVGDVVLEARFSKIIKNITYHNVEGTINPNPTTYSIEDEILLLEDVVKTGYDFKGFYTQPNGEGSLVQSIDCDKLLDYTLYAHFEIKTFNITYELNGGTVSIPNPTSYTTLTDTFTIVNPYKTDMIFVGWSGTGIEGKTKSLTISKGSEGDKVFVAHYETIQKQVKFIVEGLELDLNQLNVEYNTSFNEPEIDVNLYGMNGYTIDGWYSNPECQGEKFSFGANLTDDLILYGRWDFILGYGFYPYIEKFTQAQYEDLTQINSYEELIHWVEFIEFYDITEKIQIKLTYKTFTADSLSQEIENAREASSFPANSSIGFSYVPELSKASIYVSNSHRHHEASITCDELKVSVYEQQEYALAVEKPNLRADDFDNFNINKVKKELLVETSDQLVYAMENGLKPICKAGSKAETVYNKAKEILRDICSDNMTNVQKAQAIYEYLILNVSYDQYAAHTVAIRSNWEKYDSWYIEGALLNGKAVCDGYAKAYVLLCKIENIPSIRIIGDQHAWNKIYVEGNWFGVDATHGDTGLNNLYEILTYKEFMFTDEYKESVDYVGDNFLDIKCQTEYDYYDSVSYTYGGKTFDLLVDSQEEFNYIVNYGKSLAEKNTKYYIIEIAVRADFETSITTLVNSSGNYNINIVGKTTPQYDTAGNRVYQLLVG